MRVKNAEGCSMRRRRTRGVAALVSLALVGFLTPSAPEHEPLAVAGSAITPATVQAVPTDAFGLVDQWGRQNAPLQYGGVWVDAFGNLVAGFTEDAASFGRTLRSIFPDSHAQAVVVDYSLRDLLELQAVIDADRQEWRGEGIRIVTTGIDPSRSRVVLGVEGLDPSIKEIFAQEYGRAVILEERGYPRFKHRSTIGPPYPGGMHIRGLCWSHTDCAIADCTSNFGVWEFIHGVKFHSLLTAGHCFLHRSDVFTEWGTIVGKVAQQVWYPGTNADVEKIQMASRATPKIYTQYDDPLRLTSVAYPYSAQVFGQQGICKSGHKTGETCGWVIDQVHVTFEVCIDFACNEMWPLTDHVHASRTSGGGLDFGDSGGPVYRYIPEEAAVEAHGIAVAGYEGGFDMYYTFLPNALSRTETNLCTTVIC